MQCYVVVRASDHWDARDEDKITQQSPDEMDVSVNKLYSETLLM